MTNHATGTFEIKMTPQDDKSTDKSLGRMTIEKQWHGDLEGTSRGQMLTGGDIAKGSAGYVAIEKFTGTLKGQKGSFIFQHSATMTRGEGQLTIKVVPDSGTDQLSGLTGILKIINAKEGWVEIDHGEIKDFMPPMEMEYWIKDRSLLRSLRVGDTVDFTVVETGKGEYITKLKRKIDSKNAVK